jgi:hypothetical protein
MGVAAAGRSASAHHPVGETFAGHAQTTSQAGSEVEVAHFTLEGITGTYLTVAPLAEFAPVPWFALSGRLPLHHLWLEGDEETTGLGDLDLACKLRLAATEAFLVAGGLAAELPTGDADDGLGSGHVELSPFVTGAAHSGDWMLHGTMAALFSLSGGEHHEHINFVSPHADQELRYHLGIARALGERWSANLVVAGATVLAAEDRGTTFLTVAPQIGWTPPSAWRVWASVELPVTSDKRFDWKAIASARYLF